jgi:hypothetical protein
MTKKPGQEHRAQLAQDLKDSRNKEKRLRESVIRNAASASTLEPHTDAEMKRGLKLEDDIETIDQNDAKVAERDRERRKE